jgi:hypothetical protein
MPNMHPANSALLTGLKDRAGPLCEELAKKIIELGQQGVRNPQLLRQFAIKDFGA